MVGARAPEAVLVVNRRAPAVVTANAAHRRVDEDVDVVAVGRKLLDVPGLLKLPCGPRHHIELKRLAKRLEPDAADIEPRITYGTNPGMGIGITEAIPANASLAHSPEQGFEKALNYMGFKAGQQLLGTKVDYVFLGACTNGRIEDFRAFASIVKGRQKAQDVIAWLVPGSWAVDRQIREEGLDRILEAAGFEIRQPGCSACLAMNDDKIPAGKLSVSTSNRNFEGRQGPGARTVLASPLVAAAAAVTGVITDPRTLL